MTALGHGVTRIDRQIQDRILDLGWLRDRLPETLGGGRLYGNVLSEYPLQHGRHTRHDIIQIERPRLKRLLAREGQHALRELSSALGGFVNGRSEGCKLGVAGDCLANQFNLADDYCQNVVEVMGNTACQLANGLHLLSLPQLLLQQQAFVDVARDKQYTRPVPERHPRRATLAAPFLPASAPP